jgi:hypothetical protein
MVISAVVMLEFPCVLCSRVQSKYRRHTRESGYPVIAAHPRILGVAEYWIIRSRMMMRG